MIKESIKPKNITKINYKGIKTDLIQGNIQDSNPLEKKSKNINKSKINILAKLYSRKDCLPNSAFATNFGNPKFVNYGCPNTNSVHPKDKQVYSNTIPNNFQRPEIKKTPQKKVPEGFINTPEKVKNTKQIFQEPNNFPYRTIKRPNLLKIRYFNDGQNIKENNDFKLNDKNNKRIKINKNQQNKYNPYNHGEIDLKRKKMKDELNNISSVQNENDNNYVRNEGEEEIEESEGQILYEKKRDYYLKMIEEDNINNKSGNLNGQKLKKENSIKINTGKNFVIERNNNIKIINQESENIPQEVKNQMSLNSQIKNNNVPINRLKKKENPALFPPGYNLLKNNEEKNIICVNHFQLPINYQDRNPRNYQGMPPCMLSSIIPAGKPNHFDEPLNIFANEYTDYY